MTKGEQGRFKDHFSQAAAGYAAHRPTYPTELAAYLAQLCRHQNLAWDCGCGSGQLSRLLAQRFTHVVATDASANQIAKADAHPAIDYRCATADASSLPDGSTDLIVAAQAAHWFDLPAFYDEARRVAHADSIIALVTYGLVTVDEALDPLIARFYSNVLGPYWPPERRHVEAGYRTLPFPFDECEAPTLHICMNWTLVDFIGYVSTWSAVRALERQKGPAAIKAFERDLDHAWDNPAAQRTVRWPLSLRIGRIEKQAGR